MKILLTLLLVLSISMAKDLILVSVYPFYDLVRSVAGERFRVDVILPPRTDYHIYDLKPGDLVKIARSRVVLVTGIPIGGWEKKIEAIAGKKAYRITDEDLKDPHLWMSPKRMIRVADRIADILISVDPSGEETYRSNLRDVKVKLSNLDRMFSETLKDCRFNVIPEVHPSMFYLAKDYGLRHIPLFTGDHHGDLIPKRVEEFLRTLRTEGVDFFFDPDGGAVAEILELQGLKRYALNTTVSPKGPGDTYFSIMISNLEVLREALRCGR